MTTEENKINGGAYRIEPLRGAENYVLWKIQMEDILVDMGLWEYVLGETEKPSATKSTDGTPDPMATRWATMDCKALTQI
jgi:hypothetical protein